MLGIFTLSGHLCIFPVYRCIVADHCAKRHILLGRVSLADLTSVRLYQTLRIVPFEFQFIFEHTFLRFFPSYCFVFAAGFRFEQRNQIAA